MSAYADITVFTDRTSFTAATTSAATDDFDDLEPTELGATLLRDAGAYSYRVTAGPGDGGFYPAVFEGDTYLVASLASDVVTFGGFGPDVYGFGGSFFATDAYGAFVPGRTIELSATDGTDVITYTLDGSAATAFLGFVSSSPLTEITLRTMDEQGNVYWATANDVVLAVPEPSSYAMLLAGLGVAAFAARRRRGHASTVTN